MLFRVFERVTYETIEFFTAKDLCEANRLMARWYGEDNPDVDMEPVERR